ncbi:MAG: tRNA preQ1(34) S-adenosylmethionine ribosyltransferase-isomerase QueA [Rhodobacteraceae bacterium]|nr:tRNA preQ1(34) S-adenosylmethionine ribosyltransferase-isomerase QueA [Paracoccaceae bacterium]
MKLSDFDFNLPEHLIATRPVSPRPSARMLVATPDAIIDASVSALSDWLKHGDRLVLNNTSVIPARLSGSRIRAGAGAGGQDAVAQIEVTLLAPSGGAEWSALIKPLRKLKIGENVTFAGGLSARLLAKEDGQARLAFNLTEEAFDAALDEAGEMPLPPYIAAKRPADARDRNDYQTVFARIPGAVAAPTASLHFDQELLDALKKKGVDFTHVTLHVGAGTFLPVKVDDIKDHVMHSERGEVTAKAADEINATRAAGGRIIPVGTTALRLIETAARNSGKVTAWQGSTDIFITPGFQFLVADGLMTNFHLPKSTLMMLVSAFIGASRIRQIYAHAIAEEYRFFSYGDASLLLPGGS